MRATIADLAAQRATVGSLSIGHLGIGPITVRELTLADAALSMTGAQAVLQSVTVTVTLRISLEWHVHVGLPDGIPDIDVGDTADLGSFPFAMPVGDIVLPHLDDLQFAIPAVTAQNLSVPATALTVELTGARAEGIHATNTAAPSAGLLLAGLSLTSVAADAVSIPAATVEQATARHVLGDPLRLPALTLPGLTVPAAQVPVVRSTTPMTIPAQLQGPSPGFDAGLVRVVLHLRPSVVTRVEHLELTGAAAAVTVGQVVLHDVTLPYDVLDLTLSQVGIESVDLPALTIS